MNLDTLWKDQSTHPCIKSVRSDDFLFEQQAASTPCPAESFLSQESPQHRKSFLPSDLQADPLRRAGPYRVLVVDDDPDNLFYAECAVESLGYQWVSTSSGNMTLALALAYQPDIIMLDIWLQDLSGIEVLAQLRRSEQTAQIPTIAVTALCMPQDIEEISAAGFSGYLLKPYLIEDLKKILNLQLSI